MGEGGVILALNTFSDSTVFNVMENPYESGFSFTFKDFKLCKEDSSSFKRSGTKERTYAIRNEGEFEPLKCDFQNQLIFYIGYKETKKNLEKKIKMNPQTNVS